MKIQVNVSPIKLTNMICCKKKKKKKSSEEGLYKTQAGNIKVDESWELASPSQGRRPRSCRQFSLFRMLGE